MLEVHQQDAFLGRQEDVGDVHEQEAGEDQPYDERCVAWLLRHVVEEGRLEASAEHEQAENAERGVGNEADADRNGTCLGEASGRLLLKLGVGWEDLEVEEESY